VLDDQPCFDLIPRPNDVRPQTIVLAETESWLIGVPLSPWATAWWGSFTEWCTAIDFVGGAGGVR